MSTFSDAKVGDRIKITQPIVNDDTKSVIKVEDGLPVGLEGTIRRISRAGSIDVDWDNGSKLSLLDLVDDGRWEIIGSTRVVILDAVYPQRESKPS